MNPFEPPHGEPPAPKRAVSLVITGVAIAAVVGGAWTIYFAAQTPWLVLPIRIMTVLNGVTLVAGGVYAWGQRRIGKRSR